MVSAQVDPARRNRPGWLVTHDLPRVASIGAVVAEAGLNLVGALRRAYRWAMRGNLPVVHTDLVLRSVTRFWTGIPRTTAQWPPPGSRDWRRLGRTGLADPDPPLGIGSPPPLDDEIARAADSALRLAAYKATSRLWRGRRGRTVTLPTFSPSVRQAVYEALDEATRDGRRWAGYEHLMVAMLSQPDNAAVRFLTDWASIDFDWLVGRLRDQPSYQRDAVAPSPSALMWLKFIRVLPANAPVLLRWPWRTAVWVLTRLVRRRYRRHGAGYGHLMLAGFGPAAVEKAVALGRPYVTGAELLLAILELDEQLTSAGSTLPAELARFSEAGEILRTSGVTLDAATRATTRLTILPNDAEADLQQLPTKGWRTVRNRLAAPPYGRSCLAALRSASIAARDAGHPHAGTTHLLVAVLDEADGPAARLLHDLGTDPAAIRAEAVARLAPHSPDPSASRPAT